jgi:hypothetical protein
MTTMHNEPDKLLVEGFEAQQVDYDLLGKCYKIAPILTISDEALEMLRADHNPLRRTDIGKVNLLGAALITQAMAIQGAHPRDTKLLNGDDHVPNIRYNAGLDRAKLEASIATTHIETAIMFLHKALGRVG